MNHPSPGNTSDESSAFTPYLCQLTFRQGIHNQFTFTILNLKRLNYSLGYRLEGEPVQCLIQDNFYGATKDNRLLPTCVKKSGETFTGNGKDYTGTVSKSVDGKNCLSWNREVLRGNAFLSTTAEEARDLLVGNINSCRNPGGKEVCAFFLEHLFKSPSF